MSFTLPDSARDWQDRVRRFVEAELIPWEERAELAGGEIPAEVAARHERLALELGLPRIDAPKRHGGLELPLLDQVAIAEQTGRVTNALAWCYGEAQSWMFEACSPDQIDRFILPLMRGERHVCTAVTEEGAGSDVDDIATTARRDGDHYVIDGEKWHVTSANLADTVIVQAKAAAAKPMAATPCSSSRCRPRGSSTVRSPAYTHSYRHHHPILRFDRVRVPAANRIGAEGQGMGFIHAWFRRERLMIAARCCGAAERLIEAATAFAAERKIGGEPMAPVPAGPGDAGRQRGRAARRAAGDL